MMQGTKSPLKSIGRGRTLHHPDPGTGLARREPDPHTSPPHPGSHPLCTLSTTPSSSPPPTQPVADPGFMDRGADILLPPPAPLSFFLLFFFPSFLPYFSLMCKHVGGRAHPQLALLMGEIPAHFQPIPNLFNYFLTPTQPIPNQLIPSPPQPNLSGVAMDSAAVGCHGFVYHYSLLLC